MKCCTVSSGLLTGRCSCGGNAPCVAGSSLWVVWASLLLLLAACAVPIHCTAQANGWPAAWGSRDDGSLGDGVTLRVCEPTQALLNGLALVSAGKYHTLALTTDGAVWAWGANERGQLGDGTTTLRRAPARITGVANVVALAAGGAHSLARRSDGTVWAWGSNEYGQLGDGTTTDRSTPGAVPGLAGVVAVAAGGYHCLAVKSDGTAVAWGLNDDGQLGDGSTTPRSSPVPVSGLTGVVAVSAGRFHSLALKSDGTLWAWGRNGAGQLGDGTRTDRTVPVQVSSLTGVVGLAAGAFHSLARLSDGSLRAWGSNECGQLGNGTTDDSSTPVPVAGLAGVEAVVTGEWHCLALKSDGTVWAWGSNISAQLGDGSSSDRSIPTAVSGLSGKPAVLAAGLYHSVVVKSDGTVWSWGSDGAGQLGLGTPPLSRTPVAVSDLTGVVAVASHAHHNLALRSDGTLWAWGYNDYGQLGDGTTRDRPTPVAVSGLSAVVEVAGNGFQSLALRSDGTVWAWGDNRYGQPGDGTTTNRSSPVAVPGMSGVVSVSAGWAHSIVAKSDGTVWTWGRNNWGQLGDGTTTDRITPTLVTGLTGVVAVAGGADHSLALRSDGTVWAWGFNANGQLGDGTTTDRHVPVPVTGLTGVVSVSAGSAHSLAITSDGTAWAWGDNLHGQLGDGTTTAFRSVPVPVVNLTRVLAIEGGYEHSLAVSSTPSTRLVVPVREAAPGSAAVLEAYLYRGNDALAGRGVKFWLDGVYVGAGTTEASGRAQVSTVIPGETLESFYATEASFAGTNDLLPCSGSGWLRVLPPPAPSRVTVPDRTGTITEIVTLRGYCYRAADSTPLVGKTLEFSVDGSPVGTGITGSSGRADRSWVIPAGPATRTIGVAFPGDAYYQPSSNTGTLTCQSWTTKMATFDRTARITDRTELKCRLLRSDNVPLYNKSINFYVDGTFIISRPTNTQGYASYPYYDVPDGAGAGTRTILSEWPGNAGYAALSKTATLTVLKALPYVWVLARSVPQGGIANLYALLRRLYDYQKQEGKPVTFRIDGTWIADVVTGTTASGEPGVARYLYGTSGLTAGTHTVRCEFAGDAWVDVGYGEGGLTIY